MAESVRMPIEIASANSGKTDSQPKSEASGQSPGTQIFGEVIGKCMNESQSQAKENDPTKAGQEVQTGKRDKSSKSATDPTQLLGSNGIPTGVVNPPVVLAQPLPNVVSGLSPKQQDENAVSAESAQTPVAVMMPGGKELASVGFSATGSSDKAQMTAMVSQATDKAIASEQEQMAAVASQATDKAITSEAQMAAVVAQVMDKATSAEKAQVTAVANSVADKATASNAKAQTVTAENAVTLSVETGKLQASLEAAASESQVGNKAQLTVESENKGEIAPKITHSVNAEIATASAKDAAAIKATDVAPKTSPSVDAESKAVIAAQAAPETITTDVTGLSDKQTSGSVNAANAKTATARRNSVEVDATQSAVVAESASTPGTALPGGKAVNPVGNSVGTMIGNSLESETDVKPVEQAAKRSINPGLQAPTQQPLGTAQSTPASASSTTFQAALQTAHVSLSDNQMSAKMIHQIVTTAKLTSFADGASMSMRLDPPQLGTVQLDVTSRGGSVTAHLQTSTLAAKQMLESDLPALKQSLAESGINVDSINVSVGNGNLAHNPQQGFNGEGAYQDRYELPRFTGGVSNIEPAIVASATAARQNYGLDYLA